jgi:hypothetical protein
LLASKCEIRGERVGYNADAKCIAWMSQPTDRLLWSFEASKAGKFEVHLVWAQVDENDGNRFRIDYSDQQVTGTLPTTGGWDKYRTASFGQVDLAAGPGQLTLRAVGTIKSELADLREIRLVPVAE